jgi:hypothetical protein
MKINIKLILTHEDIEGLLKGGSYEYLFKAKENNIDSDISIIIDEAGPKIIDLPLNDAMQLTTEPTPS